MLSDKETKEKTEITTEPKTGLSQVPIFPKRPVLLTCYFLKSVTHKIDINSQNCKM